MKETGNRMGFDIVEAQKTLCKREREKKDLKTVSEIDIYSIRGLCSEDV